MTSTQKTIVVISLLLFSARAWPEGPLQGTLSLPIGVEMHLQGAGTKGDDGWYAAKSRSGSFQLKFPTPYDEWSALVGDSNTMTRNLSTTSAEGIKFLAAEFERPEGDQLNDVRSLAKSFLKSAGKRATIRNFQHQGLNGAAFSVRSGLSVTQYRFLLTPDNYYQLSVEYPVKLRTATKKISAQFFNSLYLNFSAI